jgi:mannitol 2-dehydrogenase
VHIGVGQFPPRPPGLVSAPADAGGAAQDWAIIGAGVRPYDAAMREKLIWRRIA